MIAQQRHQDKCCREVAGERDDHAVAHLDGALHVLLERAPVVQARQRIEAAAAVYDVTRDAELDRQFARAKHMGLNCLRTHIKITDPRYYDAADRAGILIWTELPNWSNLTPAVKQRARQTLTGMVERDWNHPSIIIWTIVNEGWGVDLAVNADHRAWLADGTPLVVKIRRPTAVHDIERQLFGTSLGMNCAVGQPGLGTGQLSGPGEEGGQGWIRSSPTTWRNSRPTRCSSTCGRFRTRCFLHPR